MQERRGKGREGKRGGEGEGGGFLGGRGRFRGEAGMVLRIIWGAGEGR